MLTQLFRRLQGRPTAPAPAGGVAAAGPAPFDASEHAGHSVDTAGEPLAAAELEHRFHLHLLGASQDGEPSGAASLDAALAQLETIAARFDMRRMPRLPALVPQLLAAMRRDDSDATAIAGLLARDPLLAGEVLRVANSAWYRRGPGVTSLPQAVRTIGHDGLRQVVVTTVMRPIVRGEPSHPGFGVAERLWAASEACTWLCGRLAPGRCDPGEAQLTGVIATTGAAALLRTASLPLLGDAVCDPAFSPRFTSLARELSARAAEHWRLPPAIQQAIACGGRDGAALGRVLSAAEALAMGEALVTAGRLQAEAMALTDTDLPETPTARLVLLAALRGELRGDATG